jgi:hypothetical protein
MLWPPRDPTHRYEVEGLKLAFKVLSNLGSDLPEKQLDDLADLLSKRAGWKDQNPTTSETEPHK